MLPPGVNERPSDALRVSTVAGSTFASLPLVLALFEAEAAAAGAAAASAAATAVCALAACAAGGDGDGTTIEAGAEAVVVVVVKGDDADADAPVAVRTLPDTGCCAPGRSAAVAPASARRTFSFAAARCSSATLAASASWTRASWRRCS